MKSLFLSIAGFVSLCASAQQHISINNSITDNGKNLSIVITGTVNGKPVDYNRTFDVSGMSKAQKHALQERVYDSLGLSSPAEPVAAPAPPAPIAPLAPVEPTEPVSLVAVEAPAAPVISAKSQYTQVYAIGGEHPFTKEIGYDPKTGILHMKYRFTKNGEQITKEKSVDAKNTSQQQKEQIIKKYEKEIGVLQPEII